jgi:hypothetical protein
MLLLTVKFDIIAGLQFYCRSHRGINVDHGINVDYGINVDQHSKPRNKGKYCIPYLHLFRSFEC